MSDINCLSGITSVSDATQFPVYDSGNGQPRKASGAQLAAYVATKLPSDTPGPFVLLAATVAQLAANYPPAQYNGALVYCTNGNSGVACLAMSDGIGWKRIALGAAVS